VWRRGEQAVATITLVYDHHVREVTEKLTEIQHEHSMHVISTLHVHLDAHHCLEVIAARGPARALQAIADRLIGSRGVLSGHVVPAALPRRAKRASRRRPSGVSLQQSASRPDAHHRKRASG
jgi:CopG family nickel-responsive transcriptional regulator